jgi:hypothetical protein
LYIGFQEFIHFTETVPGHVFIIKDSAEKSAHSISLEATVFLGAFVPLQGLFLASPLLCGLFCSAPLDGFLLSD